MKINRRQLIVMGGTAILGRPDCLAAANRTLKITGVETFAVRNPPPHWGGRGWVFVKLLSSSGIVGYGEVDMLGIAFQPPNVEI